MKKLLTVTVAALAVMVVFPACATKTASTETRSVTRTYTQQTTANENLPPVAERTSPAGPWGGHFSAY